MTEPSDELEEQRMERLRVLMDRAIAADRDTPSVLPLIGGVFEASVRDLPGPTRRATVRAIESGLVLLEYDTSPPEQFWVPLANVQWLKVVR